MRVALIDIDEVLFPFAHGYDAWLRRHRGHGLHPDRLARYQIPEAAGPDHNTLVVAYLNDPATDALTPVPGALEAMAELAGTFTLLGCTSRRGSDEGDATRSWVARHFPAMGDVIFTRHERGTPGVPKATFASEHHAVALIDDSAEHLVALPPACHGVLLRRPDGLLSGPGAHPWSAVNGLLRRV